MEPVSILNASSIRDTARSSNSFLFEVRKNEIGKKEKYAFINGTINVMKGKWKKWVCSTEWVKWEMYEVF